MLSQGTDNCSWSLQIRTCSANWVANIFQFCNEAVNIFTTGITEMHSSLLCSDIGYSMAGGNNGQEQGKAVLSRAIEHGIKHTSFQRTPELTCHHWDLLQRLNQQTLLLTYCQSKSPAYTAQEAVPLSMPAEYRTRGVPTRRSKRGRPTARAASILGDCKAKDQASDEEELIRPKVSSVP
jgi:hypothetical protein